MRCKTGTSLDRRTVPKGSPHKVLSTRRGDQLLAYSKGATASANAPCVEMFARKLDSWQDPTLAWGRDITETGKWTHVCAKGHPLFCCRLALGECCGLRDEVFVVLVGVLICAFDFVWRLERCGSRLVEVCSGLP